MAGNVVLLLTHMYNERIREKFMRLRNELDSSDYDVVLLVNIDYCEYGMFKGLEHYICSTDRLNALGYTPISETVVPGSSHYPLLAFYMDNNTYDYYWCIEYDVEFSGRWNVLMDAFRKDDSDYIASHVERFDVARNRDWTWWHRSNNVGYPLKNCVKSFHPIYRCSRAALCYLDEYQKKGFSAHSEVMMSTALYNAGFVVEDFGGDGDFVRQGNINRFYCCDGTVNGGTLRYRPLYSMEELECEALSDMLYHPLKI